MILKKIDQRKDGLLKYFGADGKLRKGVSMFDYLKARNEYMKKSK